MEAAFLPYNIASGPALGSPILWPLPGAVYLVGTCLANLTEFAVCDHSRQVLRKLRASSVARLRDCPAGQL